MFVGRSQPALGKPSRNESCTYFPVVCFCFEHVPDRARRFVIGADFVPPGVFILRHSLLTHFVVEDTVPARGARAEIQTVTRAATLKPRDPPHARTRTACAMCNGVFLL